MNSTELKDLFRDEMEDNAEPFLWSDALVYSYADDAQKMFCRLTDGISDVSTAKVVNLAITPGASFLATHKSILKFRSATRGDTGRPVEILNAEDLPARGWRFDGRQAPVCALVIGEEEHKVRPYPVPNETLTIQLSVFRLPLNPIDDGELELEISEQHHRHLLLWMKSLAYGKQDAETYDRTKKKEFEADFRAYCAAVKAEQEKKRHKTRVVAYGGIPMGGRPQRGGGY